MTTLVMNNYGTYRFDTNEMLKTKLVHFMVEPTRLGENIIISKIHDEAAKWSITVTFFGISGIHLLWLSISLLFGEGILFGYRVYQELIFFSMSQIAAVIFSIILVLKNNDKGYILLALSILSTYIIEFGHWMFWWPCEYCNL